MTDHRHLDYLKTTLEETLGYAVQDREWEFLCDNGDVGEVYTGASDINWLAAKHRKIWPRDKRSRTRAKAPKMVNTDRVRTREEALSVLYAQQAAEDQDVIDFREVVLAGALINWEEVPKWVKKQAAKEKKEGLPLGWLTVPLPPGTTLELDKNGNEVFKPALVIKKLDPRKGAYSTGCRTLAYTEPGNEWRLLEVVRAGGLLEKLRSLSKKLAKRYYWHEAQATAFVLTGVPPLVASCSLTVQVTPHFFKRKDGGWSSSPAERVVLTIDPALSPEHVKRVYKQYRDSAISNRQGQRASRERQYALVAFIAEHPDLKTWEERRRAWNKKFPNPKWRYEHLSNFQRDHDKTRKRLLGG